MISSEDIDKHINTLMNEARRGGAEPILIMFLDAVYRPFMKLAVTNAMHFYGENKSIKPLLDSVVDLTTLMIINTSNYVAAHEQLDEKLAFINMFFVHQASRANDMLREMYPGEDFVRMKLDEMLQPKGEKPN